MSNHTAPVSLKYVALPEPLPSLSTSDNPNLISRVAAPGGPYPCRRCLLDIQPGEELHLLSYDPFPQASLSPYRSKSPIFVHAVDCTPFHGEHLPKSQLDRQMSVRAYDKNDMIVGFGVVNADAEGVEFEETLKGLLAEKEEGMAEWVGVYNAQPGCFAVKVERG